MPDFDRLTARISRYLETTGVPAFALGIVQGQELVYARGFGRIGQIGYDSHVDHGGHVNHTVAEQQVSPDTLFPTCSTAKPFVATAILQLVEGGILDLDTPVARYLPWLCYPAGGDASRVTVRHLLTHTSGLSSDPDVPERFFAGKPACLADNLRHDIPGYGAAGRPGEVFWYSNPGFNIAGHLLEHLTGTPFSEVMTERVFTPASMTSTSFDPGFRTDQLIVDSPAPQCLPIPYPAGGAVTSIRDLARFAISHLHGGRLPGGKLLDPATIGLMHSIQADAWSRSPRWYGLGFGIDFHRGRKLVAHGGGGFGCGSTFVMVPEEKVAVLALFNHPAGYGIQAGAILDDLLGDRGPPARERNRPDPSAWPSYTGIYQSAWPDTEGYPAEIEIRSSGDSLELSVNDEVCPLRCHDHPVYEAADGRASVGFVPGGGFLMYDAVGIGLVSVQPYRRVARSDPARGTTPLHR